MNKWAMRAVGGAACTVGALAFTTGVSHADGTNSHSPHHNKSAHKAAFSRDVDVTSAVKSTLKQNEPNLHAAVDKLAGTHSPDHSTKAETSTPARRPLSEKAVKTIEHAAKSTGLTADQTGASKKAADHPRHAASTPVRQTAGSVVKAATDTVNHTTHTARHAATPVVDAWLKRVFAA